jgi:hypothetical protein
LGDLLLTEKEASGLIVGGVDASMAPRPRWAAVGKVCSPRKLVIGALERAMERAWGLHRPAQFRDIGDNRFVVRFSSEGDWYHAMNNGPWQFDFNAVLLKNYVGSVRPSDMTFDTMEVWVRVLDLPMDMMNRVFGKLIGDWVGKYITVDVDKDGIAWGKELRIRVEIRVDQPILRGVSLRESKEDVEGTWFDLKYEKIPHFCFDCGRIVHPGGSCPAEREEMKQWGEWLRASPRRNQKPPAPSRQSFSSGSYGSYSMGSDTLGRGGVTVRDLPPRRNLMRDEVYSSSSRTGGKESGYEAMDVTSPDKRHWARADEQYSGPVNVGTAPRNARQGTFTRRPRTVTGTNKPGSSQVPLSSLPKKRGPKQIWVPVPVQVVGEGATESAGKRQRTASVFDRIEEPTGEYDGGQRSNSVFNRLEDPVGTKEGEHGASGFNRRANTAAVPEARGRREQ